MKYLILLVIAISTFNPAFSQHWIIFKDKPAYDGKTKLLTDQALENRKALGLPEVQPTDIPVNTSYLQTLRENCIKVNGTSKWLNAAVANLTPEQAAKVRNMAFVAEITPVAALQPAAVSEFKPADHAQALMQMKAEVINKASLTGKGVTIGVIDAGYHGAEKTKELSHLFAEKRIMGIRDYVNPKKTDHFGEQETGLDFHGTTVLVNITGYNPDLREQSGFAYNSSFYLARTDHGVLENRGEEQNYVRALEWMDSMGVRLINTSLGYATGFTDPAENYKPAEMNGKTSLISRAVQTAAQEKGMLIVVAAGNEGGKQDWKVISTPADAQGVLSVGATDFESWTKASYSGAGPEALPYLKPDVACFSLTGTSFSAPVITGFAACLLEKNPKLKNTDLIRIIQQSSHLYPFGNNLVGYGVPQADVALALLKDPKAVKKVEHVEVTKPEFIYKVKNKNQISRNGGIVLFHKKNEVVVQLQEKGELTPKGEIKVTRHHNAARTTLQAGLEVVEIIWK